MNCGYQQPDNFECYLCHVMVYSNLAMTELKILYVIKEFGKKATEIHWFLFGNENEHDAVLKHKTKQVFSFLK